jgi:uncharacterized membrane protein
MFTSCTAIIAILLLIEGSILFLSDHPRTAWLFKYLPSMFWIYFVPMLANSFGLFAPNSPVLDTITTYCLPASLVLLLLSVDLIPIARLGAIALAVMTAGVLGIMIGGPAVVIIFKHWLDPQAWMGIGALSASWIGGSANMIAVAKATDTPNAIYLPMVVVDSIIPYCWMAIMIALSVHQGRLDKLNRARIGLIDELCKRAQSKTALPDAGSPTVTGPLYTTRLAGVCSIAAAVICVLIYFAADHLPAAKHFLIGREFIAFGVVSAAALCGIPKLRVFASNQGRNSLRSIVIIIASAIAGTILSLYAARKLPDVRGIANFSAWTIIVATFVGLAFSFTPLRSLENYGSSKLGFALLYLVLASIGAKADFSHLAATPILLVAGATWIVIHAIFLLAAVRLLRCPVSLAAAASQACVGGTASAPVLAGIYHPQLASVGLLLAVLGNITGTFLGLITFQLCRLAAQF